MLQDVPRYCLARKTPAVVERVLSGGTARARKEETGPFFAEMVAQEGVQMPGAMVPPAGHGEEETKKARFEGRMQTWGRPDPTIW